MKAIGKNVFILPDFEREDKVGLIHMPVHRNRDLPRTGTVKSIPEGMKCEFKEGDNVVYDFHKQELLNVPGEPLTLAKVKVKDVLAVLL